MRRHGWHLPFHRLQIFAIFSFFCLFTSFYLFSAPFLGRQEIISTVTMLYTSLALAVFGLYIRCAAINPEDTGISIHIPIKPFTSMDAITISNEKLDTIQDSIMKLEALHSLAVQSHQNANKSTHSKVRQILKLPVLCLSKSDNCMRDDTTSLETMANSLNCVLCNRRVSTCSKHCKSCDKCVYGFDHHCKWINNCVGKKNYSTFLALLVVTVGLLLLEVIAGIVVIVRCSTHTSGFSDRIYEKLGRSFSKGLVATIVAISSIISLVALAAVAELLLFHILLIKKGLTTYGYVVATRTLHELHSLSDYENSHSHLPVSPASSLLSSRSIGSSAFGAHYKRTWCTPPRIYLDADDQDEVAPQLPPISLLSTVDPDSTPSSASMTANRYIKPRPYKVKISPWQLARLDMDEVAKLVSKAQTTPGLNQGQASSLPVFGQAMSWPQRSSSNSNTNTLSYSSTNAIESSAKSSADGEDDEQFFPMGPPQPRALEGTSWSSIPHQQCPSAQQHPTQSLETREMPFSAKSSSYRHCQNLSRICPLGSTMASSMSSALHQECGPGPSQQRTATRWGVKFPLIPQSNLVCEDQSMPWSAVITDRDSNGSHQKADMSLPHVYDDFMGSPTLRCGHVQSSSPGSASKALLTTRAVNEEDNIIIPSSKSRGHCRSLNFEQRSHSIHVDGASIFFGGPLSRPSTPPSMASDTD